MSTFKSLLSFNKRTFEIASVISKHVSKDTYAIHFVEKLQNRIVEPTCSYSYDFGDYTSITAKYKLTPQFRTKSILVLQNAFISRSYQNLFIKYYTSFVVPGFVFNIVDKAFYRPAILPDDTPLEVYVAPASSFLDTVFDDLHLEQLSLVDDLTKIGTVATVRGIRYVENGGKYFATCHSLSRADENMLSKFNANSRYTCKNNKVTKKI